MLRLARGAARLFATWIFTTHTADAIRLAALHSAECIRCSTKGRFPSAGLYTFVRPTNGRGPLVVDHARAAFANVLCAAVIETSSARFTQRADPGAGPRTATVERAGAGRVRARTDGSVRLGVRRLEARVTRRAPTSIELHAQRLGMHLRKPEQVVVPQASPSRQSKSEEQTRCASSAIEPARFR